MRAALTSTAALSAPAFLRGLEVLSVGQGVNSISRGQVNYGRPFEPRVRPACISLPAGAVGPQGWLRDWCLAARDGYTGHMDEFDVAFQQAWAPNYTPTGEQLRFWDKGAWPLEGGGYWFDGLVKLAYALQDDALLQQAKTRLDAVVQHMNRESILFVWWLHRDKASDMSVNEAGYSEWFPQWASGFLGRSLSAYYGASGDPHVLQALQWGYDGDYNWLRRRFAQTSIFAAFETYTWSGNPKIQSSLTELFEKRVNKNMPGKPAEIGMPFSIVMPDDKSPWYEQAGHYTYNDGGWVTAEKVHGTMFNELASPWMLGYLWTGKREFLDAVVRYYDLVERDSMQPYGAMVADEFGGPTGAARGTETCTVASYMWSQIELMRITGLAAMGDRVERAFFNAVPAVVSREFNTHVYTQTANRVTPAGGGRDYQRKHWPLCCTASLNRLLPNYVMHMWMATYDNGLAAMLYGPGKVSALVADRVPVELTSRTHYPFGESIEIDVQLARETAFPLSFRIPGWCKNPSLMVNGTVLKTAADANGFVRVERRWKSGDTVRLQFPMVARVVTGRDVNASNAPYATVHYGPLLFVLPIADQKDGNTPDPAARWKYALDTPGEHLGAGITVERGPMPTRWNWPLESPLKLRVPVKPALWDGKVLPAQAVAGRGPAESIALVPYGCTKFRVALLPVTERTLTQAAKI
ncbi:MAG: glycoside hydrolase family 127 protein [Acidobacteria bacterium]|nr:glycoside hydrolase family 127 protein [Acidobacteriota bacterium]